MTAVKSLLLIEDDIEFQKVLGQEISKLNMNVVLAKDVAEAQSRIAFQSFDIIVTDIRLGKGSGLSFIVDLKQKARVFPHVIVMTGLEVTSDVREKLTKGLGVREILEKPFNLSAFKTYLLGVA